LTLDPLRSNLRVQAEGDSPMSQKYFGKSQAEKENRQEVRDRHESRDPRDSPLEIFRSETEVNIAYRGDRKDVQRQHKDD
jgi:hypothetical protein